MEPYIAGLSSEISYHMQKADELRSLIAKEEAPCKQRRCVEELQAAEETVERLRSERRAAMQSALPGILLTLVLLLPFQVFVGHSQRSLQASLNVLLSSDLHSTAFTNKLYCIDALCNFNE